jgi:hypothetical protein
MKHGKRAGGRGGGLRLSYLESEHARTVDTYPTHFEWRIVTVGPSKPPCCTGNIACDALARP